MSTGYNIAGGLEDVRRALLKFEVAVLSMRPCKSRNMLKGYCKKLEWILMDFKTCPDWGPELLEKLREILDKSDPLTTEAIVQKLDYLDPEQREQVEIAVDELVRLRKEAGQQAKKTLKKQ